MSTYTTVVVQCDWPGCRGTNRGGGSSTVTVRAEAAREGWKSFNGLIDLCGPADKAEDWATGRDELRNHADADHQPDVTPHGKNGTATVACTCGWKDPIGFPLPRRMVGYRWTLHIEDDRQAQDRIVPKDHTIEQRNGT